jgi:hypothetical protein
MVKRNLLIPAIEDSHNVLNMQTWEETKQEDTRNKTYPIVSQS